MINSCVSVSLWWSKVLSDTSQCLINISRIPRDLPSNPPISWSRLVVDYSGDSTLYYSCRAFNSVHFCTGLSWGDSDYLFRSVCVFQGTSQVKVYSVYEQKCDRSTGTKRMIWFITKSLINHLIHLSSKNAPTNAARLCSATGNTWEYVSFAEPTVYVLASCRPPGHPGNSWDEFDMLLSHFPQVRV